MANPADAYAGSKCDSCGNEVGEGNPIFFDDGEKLCQECAEDNNNVCECGQYKKADFKECYECSRS